MKRIYEGKTKDVYSLENGNVNKNVRKNQTVSIIPFTDKATISSSKGLYYGFNELTLTKGDTVGIVVDIQVSIIIGL